MNISIVTNYDLAATYALNLLLASPTLKQHQVSVFYTRKKSNKAHAKQLAELSEFEASILDHWQQNHDKPNRFTTLENLAVRHNISIEEMNAINTTDFSRLDATTPDLIVSIRHMSILKDAVISLPTHGVINLHSGILPAYQGVMATFWAMLNKESQLGTTLHWIDSAEIDSGETIAIHRNSAKANQSYLKNVIDLYQPGCDLILNAIQTLADQKTVLSTPQQGKANYFSFPQENDFAEFEKAGNTLFNSQDKAELIEL